jgi:hypothetical protein
MGPNGNLQGGFKFMSLKTGQKIDRKVGLSSNASFAIAK